MQWQRLLRSAAAVVGAAALGCDSAPSLHAAQSPVPLTQPDAARSQKPDAPPGVVTPTSAAAPIDPTRGGRVVASVRALVNGVPILDSELTEAALGPLSVLNPNAPDYAGEVKKIKDLMLEQLIDRELLVQDAIRKLTGIGKKNVLEEVYNDSDAQFQKWVKQASAAFKGEEEFKKYLKARGTSYEGQKRLKRRITLAEEYLRSNIMRYVERRSGHQEVYEYYKAHPEEFQRSDSVQWQDIFLDAGDTKKYPTRDAALRAAQELAARAKGLSTDDFTALCKTSDDGLAKTRKGAAGFGTKREDINPPEAAAVLFQLHDGDVGPLVPVPAGYHVPRLVKRTHAGLAPFDDEVQKAIKDKLRNEAFAQESKRFLDELKSKAVIERPPAGP